MEERVICYISEMKQRGRRKSKINQVQRCIDEKKKVGDPNYICRRARMFLDIHLGGEIGEIIKEGGR